MKDIPKVELHLHLEGAMPPDFTRTLAAEKSLDLSGIFTERGGYAYEDFFHFLKVYEAATSVLQSPDDFARLTKRICEDLAEQGVIYAETFVSPDFCGGGDVAAWRDYMLAMQEAALGVEAQGGPTLRAIVTCIRHFGPDNAKAPALCAAETVGDFVTGFGMGGDETVGLQQDYAWAFDCAREAGLRLTTHAGEFGGPDSVREALDLGVERIGHGVRAFEDLALVDDLAERGTVLEVCPGSNVFLGLYPHLRQHPICELHKRGVKVTVSTDDPPFFRTDLTKEYEGLNAAFDWDRSEFTALNRIAAEAAFCDDATRTRLLERLTDA